MPCKDITERLHLKLDEHDRLVDYKLVKETCGAAVGDESLLLGLFKDRPYGDVLDLDTERFCKLYPVDKRLQFLYLKHFIAVTALLRVYIGQEAGGVKDFCTIVEIDSNHGQIAIEARIAVDAVTEEIKACGLCDGCGKQSSKSYGRKRIKSAKSDRLA